MRPAWIYMHVPKCGGTTLTAILTAAVPEGRRFAVDGRDIAGSRTALAALGEEERRRIDLLHGHLSYGWHELVAPKTARYFALVREPVSRVVSHFDYVRTRPAHYLHTDVVGGRMTIADYVESGITWEVNNGQVRQIAGGEDIAQTPYGPSTIAAYGDDHGALLERAWENIERHFLMVGLLERFDESMRRLRRLTGLPIGAYRAKNAAPPAARRPPTPGEEEVIRRYNRQDCELYRRCREAFERARPGPARARLWRLVQGPS